MRKDETTKNGLLEIGGVSSDKLATACGTPLFVYDEAELDKRMQDYKSFFQSKLFATEVIYASKAFTCKAMLQKLKRYGFGLDVVSGGELYLAKEADFPMEKIYFHGNNKSDEELEMALSYGCGTIVIDGILECRRLVELAEKQKIAVNAMIRVNPGITAHTHKYIITGDLDSKFGVNLREEDVLTKMAAVIASSSYVSLTGLHVHIGSQIFDLRAYDVLIERMMKLIKKLKMMHMIEIRQLDLGGGFGVFYTEEDKPKAIQEICQRIIEKCETELKKNGIAIEKIMVEPGRSIVAEAGYTIYRVGFLKETPNKSYLFIDGGMTDNIRVALYHAKYRCDLANKMDREKTMRYTVAGKCCESGDILIENAALPEGSPGDLLVVYGTGAYGYSMANNYNRLAKPAVVFASDGRARIVVKRENYNDLIRLETEEEVIL